MPSSSQVWIGPSSEVERCLNGVGADLGENDLFLIDIPNDEYDGAMVFLGSEVELMVTADMTFQKNGLPVPLISILQQSANHSQPIIEIGQDE